jgi:2-oxoglutarate ferredoxin oxidoreductase subunit alpha
VTTCKNFDLSRARIDRGNFSRRVEKSENTGAAGHYLRFKLSDSDPISPRIPLGTEGAIFWNTGDEHTEEGHITEDPEVRTRMMEKRMGKLDLALTEIPASEMAREYGDKTSDIALLTWGSTKGVILDAMEMLEENDGIRVKMIQLRLMNPFPRELVESMLRDCKVVIDVEMNYSGQLGSLVMQNIGRKMDYQIVKYNGRPMSLDEVYNAVKRIVAAYKNGSKSPRRQVLKSGA